MSDVQPPRDYPETIVFVAHLAVDKFLSGADISLIELAIGLHRDRFRPVVLTPQVGLINKNLAEHNVTVHVGGCPFWPFMMPQNDVLLQMTKFFQNSTQQVHSLRSWLKKYQPSILHVNTVVNPLAAIIAREMCIPVIWHIREILPSGVGRNRVLRFVHQTANRVLAVSRAVAETFAAEGQTSKVEIMYNGVASPPADISQKAAKFRSTFGIPAHVALVGFLGTLIPMKGVEVFLQMASRVLKVQPNIHFAVVGEEYGRVGYQVELHKMAETLGISHRVFFTGFYHPGEIALAAMDIVTVPSVFQEPFSRVTAEGMMLGKPVIASRSGGIPELVVHGTTGLLFPPKDVSAFADSVLTLLSNRRSLLQMGLNGQKRARQLFALPDKIARLESIYEELIRFT